MLLEEPFRIARQRNIPCVLDIDTELKVKKYVSCGMKKATETPIITGENRMITTLVLSFALMAALFLMIWAAVALVQKKKYFSSAPKDIQEVIVERVNERFRGARLLGYGIMALCMAVFPVTFFYAGWDGIRNEFGFWGFFARYLTMLYFMQAFDMIFLDWYLLTKSHFYQHYYPETEGCEGFQCYGFNLKEQISKIIAFPFAALLLAEICILIS